MGIDGLLKNLKKCMQEKNLQQYRGQKAAVDTYAWLHKIIKGPSGKQIIAGKDPTKYVNDCIRRAEKISKVGIDLILVFDGGVLPGKLKEEESRRKRRQENLQNGKQSMKKGNIEQGLKKMIDSIDVSPDIAYKLIDQLKNRGIKFIIAPYQADAQLAYLSRTGIVDLIITEDSDLLAFGAKKILYKLDFSTLNGQQICLESIKSQPQAGFNWFTHNMFLSTCIMAGCDYLNQIKGVGMKLAQKVIAKNHTLKKALAEISQSKQIPQNYQDNFLKAMLTFRFQRVYCPIRKCCVSVNQMQPKQWRQIKQIQKNNLWCDQVLDFQMLEFALKLSADQNHPDWEFLGRKLSNDVAKQIAQGDINPITFSAYDQKCLEKLRYENQGLSFMIKKPSNYSVKQVHQKSTILKYCKPIQKKNPLQYKNTKPRSTTEEQYKAYTREQKNATYFPVTSVAQLKNKKSLRFNDDSDQQEQRGENSVVSNIQSVELISSGESRAVESSQEVKSVNSIKSDKAVTEFRNRLEQISEVMFGKIFSDEFLQSPFSF